MASSEGTMKGNCSNASTEPQNAHSPSTAKDIDAEATLYRELWHACAGPFVTVPREGEHIFYFPQGHIEQVEASTNQVADQHMPAEPDTDEVFAQVTLLPEPNQDENAVEKEPPPAPPPRFHKDTHFKFLHLLPSLP